MAIAERLQILIDADSKGAQREFAAFGRVTERELSKSDQKLQQMAGGMVAFGATTAVAGGVAAAGLYKLAQASSNLSEAQNAANVTLGKSGAKALEDYAETAAQTAGVSKRAALEYGASFALFVQNAGYVGEEAGNVSSDLVQLAGDISSLRNVPVEEALVSLRSALAGESEAIRRLGIDTSDAALKNEIFQRTGERVTGVLSQQVRTQEIINKLFKDGAVFQGDFVNTSDELANRQRALAAEFENASAAIGESLVPTFEVLVGGVSGVVSGFNELSPTAQQAVGGFAGITAASAIAAGGLAVAVGQTIKLSQSYKALATQSALLRTTLAGPVPFVVSLGIVAGTLTLLDEATGRTENLAKATTKLKEALGEGDPALKRFQALSTAKDSFLSKLNPFNTDEFNDLTQEAITFADGTVAQFDKVENAVNEAATGGAASLNELRDQIEAQRDTVSRTSEAWRDYGRILDLIEQKQRENTDPDIGNATGRFFALSTGATDRTTKGLDDNAESTEEAAGAAEQLKASLARLTGQQKLTSLAFDTGRARADSFAAALERSTNADDLLAAGAGAGRALSSLRRTLGLLPEDTEQAAEGTDAAAEAMERLNDAVSRTDPTLSRLSILLGASGAAAQAFGSSLDQAGRFGDKLEAALGLGDAFTEFRKTFRRLPDDIDIAAVSLGKLRPRTAEAVRGVLALGDATKDYLSSLIESGASYDEVRSESARLRAEYAAQFAQLGLTAEQLDEYLRLTGTAPDQIETAIKLAGVEGARFKLQAYLGLLDGRIPPEVATRIVPLIESGNLEGAAAELAAFAATNPAKIDVAPDGTKELDEVTGKITDLPRRYDALTAATGGYSEANLDALEGVLGLGDAYQDFLSEVVSTDPEKAIGYAQQLRDSFDQTVAGLGLTQDELESYHILLGITDDQVTTAIELSNFDATVFEITTVIALLEGIGELDPEVALRISDALLRGDYAEVRELLEGQVDSKLGLNDEEARTKLQTFRDFVSANPSVNPVDADTDPAAARVLDLVRWVRGITADITIGAQVGDAVATAAGRAAIIAGDVFGSTVIDWSDPKYRNKPEGGRAAGGPVWPGTWLVGEQGPELLTIGGSGHVTNAADTAAMLSPPPLASADAANNTRMLSRVAEAVEAMNSGTTINGGMTVVSPEPELAGVALIRELRKRNYLGV